MTEPSRSAPARSARKPKGEGHERRAEILAAAERLFVELGYEGATIRKIADEVGLSSTALYMHFHDKSEILAEICRTAFADLSSANAEILARDAPAQARLREMLAAYARFALENPNTYRLLYMTRPEEARSGAEAVAREVGMTLYHNFCDLVGEVHARGLLLRGPETTAQVLWSGVHGVVSLIITKPYFEWGDQGELIDAMLDALFRGVMRP